MSSCGGNDVIVIKTVRQLIQQTGNQCVPVYHRVGSGSGFRYYHVNGCAAVEIVKQGPPVFVIGVRSIFLQGLERRVTTFPFVEIAKLKQLLRLEVEAFFLGDNGFGHILVVGVDALQREVVWLLLYLFVFHNSGMISYGHKFR